MLEFQWLWGFLWGRFSWVGWSGWKWVKGLVLLGRAWVSSLPEFFLGKCFHFWKLPPYLCINNRDNVYYPIFLTWYIVSKTNIKYTVSCIISVCMPVKMVSKMSGFYLGKARVGVLSLPIPSIYPQHQNQKPTLPQQPCNYCRQQYSVTASTNLAIIFTRYTLHNQHQRPWSP